MSEHKLNTLKYDVHMDGDIKELTIYSDNFSYHYEGHEAHAIAKAIHEAAALRDDEAAKLVEALKDYVYCDENHIDKTPNVRRQAKEAIAAWEQSK